MLRSLIEFSSKHVPYDPMKRIRFEISLYIFLARFLSAKELDQCIENYTFFVREFEDIFGDKMNEGNIAGKTYRWLKEQLERFKTLKSAK